MSRPRQQLIVITGPTASGKSELGVTLAGRFNGEIISADSRQVYRDLNLGTGKVPGQWKKRPRSAGSGTWFLYRSVPHHCIDFADPNRQFSAAEFQTCATGAITDIAARGKIPFLVGGTGFWIDAVACGMKLPDVLPDPKLRATLEKKSPGELYARLTRLDPRRAASIDPKNSRRLIRAIEIAANLGSVPRVRTRRHFNVLRIGIRIPSAALKERIAARMDRRLRQGMIRETANLHTRGLSWQRLDSLGLEYRLIARYLRGMLLKKQELRKKLIQADWQYAKRQMTWFRKNRAIRWIRNGAEAEYAVRTFLRASAAPNPQQKTRN